MGEDRDRADVRIGDERGEHGLEGVARVHRAVAVVDVVGHVAAGGPGEQDRGDLDAGVGAGVVDDLGETVDRLHEAGVVTVDEDQDLMALRFRNPGVEPRLGLRKVHPVDPKGDEIPVRVARRPARPFDLAGLVGARGRDRHENVGELKPPAPGPPEDDAGRVEDRGARRRRQDVDRGRSGGGGAGDQIAVGSAGAGGDQRRKAERGRDDGSAPSRSRHDLPHVPEGRRRTARARTHVRTARYVPGPRQS